MTDDEGLSDLPVPLVYEGEVIHERGGMLSLTDMWTAARRKHVEDGGDPADYENRRPDDWKKDAANRSFLDQVARALNARPEGIWIGRRGVGGGTFAHWQVALHVAIELAALVWWAPAIVLMLGRLAASWLRFEVAIGLGRALVAAGWPGAASRLYGAEIARAERRMRAVEGRRGW